MSEMTEAQMVNLVRNSLVVAGHEMGEDGDHWPVIKATVHSIMKDWENLQIERNVLSEFKTQYEHIMKELREIRAEAPDAAKKEIDSMLVDLQQIYDASFAAVYERDTYIDEDDIPPHMQRAEAIIETLEADNG
jgi:cobalamin biosynthesis Co2+ chelatase CbiK